MGHAIAQPHQHIVKSKPFFMTRTLFIIFLLATFAASFAHAQQDITMDSIIRTIQDNDVHTKVKKDSVPPKRIRVNGFRVQVYYGGNNQKSKLQARQMAQRVKIWFEDLSVYTTFSSPHWICRVGDFQTREEAMEVLYPGVENFRARYNEFAYRNLDADTLGYVNTLWESLKIS